MKKIILVDGNSLVYKAYYATAHIGNPLKAPCGTATNALKTTANMIMNLIKNRKPDYMLVAFDAGKVTFRHAKLDSYKAGRSKTPEELKEQLPLVREYLDLLGIKHFEIKNYEADDIIATMAERAVNEDIFVEVFSSDKDLLQLVNDNTSIFLTNKGVSNIEEVNIDNFKEKYEVTPIQIKDMKGLVGDKSDNLIGVPGVGEKTAIKLINQYQSVEKIYENISQVKGKIQEKLITNQKSALLCKSIATLYFDVNIPFNIKETEVSEEKFQKEKMENFLQKYALNSIFKWFDLSATKEVQIDFDILKDLPNWFKSKEVGICVELEDVNYNMSNVLGIAISDKKNNIFISSEHFDRAIKLKEYLATKNSKIVFATAKTINSLKRFGLEINNITFDIQLASYVLDHKITPDIFRVEQFFTSSRTIKSRKEVYGKGIKKQIPSLGELAKYATSKTRWIFESKSIFIELLNSKGVESLYFDIEFPLAFILADMESTGILINRDILRELELKASDKLEVLEEQIKFMAEDEQLNVSSPSQLGVILAEKLNLSIPKTKTGQYSTSSEVLLSLIDEHEIIKYIILYRKYSKLLSTYIKGIQEFIQEDGRVHTIYNQAITETGRLSSKYPNVQNISIKNNMQKEFRKVFVAGQEKSLVSFDYSQIELRILAHLSKSVALIKAFKNNEDIHRETASKVFNIGIDKVNIHQRSQAKAVNFGIIYGISDFGLSKQLNIPIFKAKEIINSYKKAYPEIEIFRLQCINQAKENGFVKTMFNRKRYIPELESPSHIKREFGKRAATNAPIQGAASDIIKKAMINIDAKIKEFNFDAKMILQIHDELVFEISNQDLHSAEKMIIEEMNKVYQMLVPLEVNFSSGKNLFDLK